MHTKRWIAVLPLRSTLLWVHLYMQSIYMHATGKMKKKSTVSSRKPPLNYKELAFYPVHCLTTCWACGYNKANSHSDMTAKAGGIKLKSWLMSDLVASIATTTTCVLYHRYHWVVARCECSPDTALLFVCEAVWLLDCVLWPYTANNTLPCLLTLKRNILYSWQQALCFSLATLCNHQERHFLCQHNVLYITM